MPAGEKAAQTGHFDQRELVVVEVRLCDAVADNGKLFLAQAVGVETGGGAAETVVGHEDVGVAVVAARNDGLLIVDHPVARVEFHADMNVVVVYQPALDIFPARARLVEARSLRFAENVRHLLLCHAALHGTSACGGSVQAEHGKQQREHQHLKSFFLFHRRIVFGWL